MKELHYFDIPHRKPLIIHRDKNSPRGRRVLFARRQLKRHPLWVLRYLLLPRTDRWYQSLFSPAVHQICGEASPGYSRMSPPDIAKVKNLIPDVRLIYILRNPVEQVWSQAKMWAHKFQVTPFDDLSPNEVMNIIERNRDSFQRHADYLGNLTRWRQHFPNEQIYVAYFDDLQADPMEFMRSILTFLDLPMADTFDPVELATPRNARPSRPMHDEVRHWFIEQWYEKMVALNDYLAHPHTASWLHQAQAFRDRRA